MVYNYMKVVKDDKTPAMRLSLAKAPLSYADIIYFNCPPMGKAKTVDDYLGLLLRVRRRENASRFSF